MIDKNEYDAISNKVYQILSSFFLRLSLILLVILFILNRVIS